MPRLTNHDYIYRHHFLKAVWHSEDRFFSMLPASSQMELHEFYVPTKDLSTTELVAHRRMVSKESPSLPNRASKAFHQIERPYLAALERYRRNKKTTTQAPAKVTSGRGGRVVVRPLMRPEPDLDKIVSALVAMINKGSKEP